MAQPPNVSFLFYCSGTIALLLMAMAVLIFFFNYQRRVQKQREAEFEKDKLHQHNILKAVIETKEKEQQRIGQDLHDDIGVQLSIIKMTLRSISGHKEYPTTLLDKLDEQSARLGNVIESVRKISQDLMPAIIEQFGLVKALDSLMSNVREQTHVEVDFFADSTSIVFLTDAQELGIYRIVQELLNNSLKHGHPTYIRLDVLEEDRSLMFVYSDNGKGFCNEKDIDEPKMQGLGLKNLEARAQLLNGTISWESAPNEGFTAHLVLPLYHLATSYNEAELQQ